MFVLTGQVSILMPLSLTYSHRTNISGDALIKHTYSPKFIKNSNRDGLRFFNLLNTVLGVTNISSIKKLHDNV